MSSEQQGSTAPMVQKDGSSISLHISWEDPLHSKVYNLLLTQLLLIQNHFQTLVTIPAHFAKAVFLVEPLGWKLEDGGIKMQGLIAESAGTGSARSGLVRFKAPIATNKPSHSPIRNSPRFLRYTSS